MTEPTQFNFANLSDASFAKKFPGTLRGKLRHNVEMSRHTSWRAGGCARRAYQPADVADLAIFLNNLPAHEPLLVVGLGSNLLVRDGGWPGTVLLLHAALNEMHLQPNDTLYVEAGVPGAKIARFAALHHLRGAEFFAGIPGTMGGMLAMNAGCYGSETWDVVSSVQTVNGRGEIIERQPAAFDISYRTVIKREQNILNATSDGVGAADEIFVSAHLQLALGNSEISRQEIKALLSKRIASQPLQLPNAGSVFRNPPGDYAARLIEQCDLKGRQLGGAQVSTKHANFIVNVGGASAADIENLINEVQALVQQKTGVHLHPEVRIVGDKRNGI